MGIQKRDTVGLIKLDEILCNPGLEEEHQEVFSFIKGLTDKGPNHNDLTAETINHWNKKFDDVLRQLSLQSSKEDSDHIE
jgi:hypothetical protein